MRLWFDENQILWDEHDESRWHVTGKNGRRIVELGSSSRFSYPNKTVNDGDVFVWERSPCPYDGPVYKEGEDYIPKIIADLNYHDSEFFTKLEEAINGH
jgi:hypothetical protein